MFVHVKFARNSLQLAERMRRAGIAVETWPLPGTPHGILPMRGSYAEKLRRTRMAWPAPDGLIPFSTLLSY